MQIRDENDDQVLGLKTVANSIVSWMDRNCPSHSNCDKKVGTSVRYRNCCGHSRPFVNGEKKESMNSALTSKRSNNSFVVPFPAKVTSVEQNLEADLEVL